jgi:hypothetical protein
MTFQLVPVHQELHVAGRSELEDVGEFAGVVVAIGMRAEDPVAEVAPQGAPDRQAATEALHGWGTTYLLVVDDRRPEPVWVVKSDVERQALGGPPQ